MAERAGAAFDIPADGARLPGYLALPAAGRGPGVLVLHEAWGLVDQIRGVCDRFARAGWVALAPDLYRGDVAETQDAAVARVSTLDAEAVGRDLEAAVGALLNHHAVEGGRVGVVGFCMGGHLSLVTAARSARVGAAVDFYGGALPVPVDVERIEAAVLAVFAEKDEWISREAVDELEAEFERSGTRAHVVVEPGVSHAFMNDARPDVYDASVAERNWDRMLAFLRAELG